MKTVLVGGVMYLAGQPVPDEVAATITADVWGDDAPAETPAPRRRGPKAKE